MKNAFLIFSVSLAIIFLFSRFSFAYVSSQDINPLLPYNVNPLDYFKNSNLTNLPGAQNIGKAVPALPNWDILKPGNFSSNDLTGALKAVATLAINLFLIVIQVVAGILKALLPFLN